VCKLYSEGVPIVPGLPSLLWRAIDTERKRARKLGSPLTALLTPLEVRRSDLISRTPHCDCAKGPWGAGHEQGAQGVEVLQQGQALRQQLSVVVLWQLGEDEGVQG